MEAMRKAAFETVMRACAFGSLAIFCMMFGLSFDGRIAFKTGGALTLVMVFILIFKAYESQTKDYRRTEMWLYLSKEERPPKAFAQWAASLVLWDTYLKFALWTAMVSIGMWVLAIVFHLVSD
jgi:Ca2+/Na+ antiporter